MVDGCSVGFVDGWFVVVWREWLGTCWLLVVWLRVCWCDYLIIVVVCGLFGCLVVLIWLVWCDTVLIVLLFVYCMFAYCVGVW